ncbi:MAG: Gfo/Idh/MocA family oxidoreductase [Phycisphaerales bacterium]
MGDAALRTPPNAPPPLPLRVGVIGLGFMGSTHVRCYQAATHAGVACRLDAVADRDAARLTGTAAVAGNIGTGTPERLFDPRLVRTYSSPPDLIADPAIDAVSICTYTRSHVDLAIAAIHAGKHVLVEKPVALDIAEAERLEREAASHPGQVCMPAMVMRFWAGWGMVRDAIRAGARVPSDGASLASASASERASLTDLGPLRSLTLTRRGSTPAWSPRFYGDLGQTGGALFDLHVHDADFVLWSLGMPTRVSTTGDLRHATTIYRYLGRRTRSSGSGAGVPIHVVAEGGTDHDPAHGFHIRMTACFEHATIDFDLGRTPNMLIARNAQAAPALDTSTPELAPFDAEIRAFVAAALAARAAPAKPAPQPVPIADAVAVLRLLHAEKASMDAGHEVDLASSTLGSP